MALQPNQIPTNPDVAIVGAGVVGLWCARKAMQSGLSVVIIDKQQIGQGASGGILGALMPHRPVNWTETQAFQLDALLSLETEIARLEAETGLSCGYNRCGRIMPINSKTFLAEHEQWQAGSRQRWPARSAAGERISWDIIHGVPRPGWPILKSAYVAYSFDTMSARINPRSLLKTLVHAVRHEAVIAEHRWVESISETGRVVLANGTSLSPGRVIVTAGHDSFGLLRPVLKCQAGWGVKGQAIMLRARESTFVNKPIVYEGGTYVISHGDGLVAVGSTSSRTFKDDRVDELASHQLMQRASELCPALSGATIVEQWAGIRPRAAGRDPIVGRLPNAPQVIVASGGFRITLGIAHKMADAALALVQDAPCNVPRSFTVEEHVAKATSSAK